MNDSIKDNDCINPENNSKCCFFKVANAFLLLANLLLLIVGFYYLPTKPDNAYFSIIVAVLAILVTVLITWQIWQTIDIKNEIKILHSQYQTKLDALANYIKLLEEWRKDYVKEVATEHSFIQGVHVFHKALWDEERVEDMPTIIGNLYIQYITALDYYIASLAKGETEANEIVNYLLNALGRIENAIDDIKQGKDNDILTKDQLKTIASLFATFDKYFNDCYSRFRVANIDSDLLDSIENMRQKRKQLCEDISNL